MFEDCIGPRGRGLTRVCAPTNWKRAFCCPSRPTTAPPPQGEEEEEAEEPAEAGAAPPAAERAGSGAGASTSGGEGGDGGGEAAAPAAKRPKLFNKLGKDPTVRTDFLPDKDREVAAEELRQKLKRVGGFFSWGGGGCLVCCGSRVVGRTALDSTARERVSVCRDVVFSTASSC